MKSTSFSSPITSQEQGDEISLKIAKSKKGKHMTSITKLYILQEVVKNCRSVKEVSKVVKKSCVSVWSVV